MSALLFNQDFPARMSRPLTVILLDDDRYDRKRIARWIRKSSDVPVTLLEAADLDAFSDLVRVHQPDMVVMDYQLADGDGVDAMEIYCKSTGTLSAYVIMVSGAEAPGKARRAMQCGCDRFLEKSELSAGSIAQFLAEMRGQQVENKTRKHPKLPVVDFWVARARRRDIGDQAVKAPAVRDHNPPRVDVKPMAMPRSVWDRDWSGRAEFLNDFLRDDDMDFFQHKQHET